MKLNGFNELGKVPNVLQSFGINVNLKQGINAKNNINHEINKYLNGEYGTVADLII